MSSSVKDQRKNTDTLERAVEISKYKNKLEQFNINLYDLPQLTPSCVESREKAIKLAKELAQDHETIQRIKTNRCLPDNKLKKIKSLSPIPVHYIMAMIIMFVGEYKTLISFLNG